MTDILLQQVKSFRPSVLVDLTCESGWHDITIYT